MSLTIKAISFLVITTSFALLIGQWAGGISIPAYNDFVSVVERGPFEGVPAWPSLPEPSQAINSTGWWLRGPREDGRTMHQCNPTLRELIMDSAGVPPPSVITLTETYDCWNVATEVGVVFRSGTWSITLTGNATAGTSTTIRSEIWISAPAPFPPHNFNLQAVICARMDIEISATGAFSETVTCNGDAINYYQTYWSLTLIMRRSSGSRTVTVDFDGNVNTFLTTPEQTGPDSDCTWYNPFTYGSCVADVGSAILYAGGIIWVALSHIFSFLKWFFEMIIGFFGATIGLAQFTVTLGGTAPQEISVILTAIYMIMVSIIILDVVRLIRGTGP